MAPMTDASEASLRAAVEDLKQRGGRTLSLADLVIAGTLGVEEAAYLVTRVQEGASFFTAAVPGGAGKTTVMAALMGAIPPGEQVVPVSDASRMRAPAQGRVTWLAHEIQDAAYYGYLWGPAVAEYIEKAREGDRIVSCLHADDLRQVESILTGPPNRVDRDHIQAVDLLIFLEVLRGARGPVRRVSSVLEVQDGVHKPVFRYDPSSGTHLLVGSPQVSPTRVARSRAVLECLVRDGVRDWAAVRAALVR